MEPGFWGKIVTPLGRCVTRSRKGKEHLSPYSRSRYLLSGFFGLAGSPLLLTGVL